MGRFSCIGIWRMKRDIKFPSQYFKHFFTIHPPPALVECNQNAQPSSASSAAVSNKTRQCWPKCICSRMGWDNYFCVHNLPPLNFMQDGVELTSCQSSELHVLSITLLPTQICALPGGSTFRYGRRKPIGSVLIGPWRNGTGDFGPKSGSFRFGLGSPAVKLGDDFPLPDIQDRSQNAIKLPPNWTWTTPSKYKAFLQTSKFCRANENKACPYRLTILNACWDNIIRPDGPGCIALISFSGPKWQLDSARPIIAVYCGRVTTRIWSVGPKNNGVPGGNHLFLWLLDAERNAYLKVVFNVIGVMFERSGFPQMKSSPSSPPWPNQKKLPLLPKSPFHSLQDQWARFYRLRRHSEKVLPP